MLNREVRSLELPYQDLREQVSGAAAVAIAAYDYASRVDPLAMRWQATYATDQSTNIAVLNGNRSPYLVEVGLLIPKGLFYTAKLRMDGFAEVTASCRDETRDEVHSVKFSYPNALRAATLIAKLATRKVARTADTKLAEIVTLQTNYHESLSNQR